MALRSRLRRTASKRVRISFLIKFYGKGETEPFAEFRTRIPAKAKRIVRDGIYDRVYVKVHYYPNVWNDGEYDNRKDALHAMTAWTEKQQLDFMESHTWS